jgi:Ca2+-binding EF-hand superfamily protein
MARARLVAGVAAGWLAVVALAVQTGCATNKSPLANASLVDREFAVAAITWDLDQDGQVTCEEWKQYATQLFREADRNRDGFLSREEYAAMSRTDRLFDSAGFAYFDANGDGRISLAEITDKPNPAFTLLDRDHDCVLGPDELAGHRPSGDGAGKGKRGHRP